MSQGPVDINDTTTDNWGWSQEGDIVKNGIIYRTPNGTCFVKLWTGEVVGIPNPQIASDYFGSGWGSAITNVDDINQVGWTGIKDCPPCPTCPPNDCSAIEGVLNDTTNRLKDCQIDTSSLTSSLTDELNVTKGENKVLTDTLSKCKSDLSSATGPSSVNSVSKAGVSELIKELLKRLFSWSK